jgi:hypothetical protein
MTFWFMNSWSWHSTSLRNVLTRFYFYFYLFIYFLFFAVVWKPGDDEMVERPLAQRGFRFLGWGSGVPGCYSKLGRFRFGSEL